MADEDIKLKVSADTKDAESGLNDLTKKTEAFSKRNEKLFDNFKKTGAMMTGMAAAGVGLIATLGSAVGKMENMQVALNTAFGGDQSAANAAFKTISDFSAKTPYQLEEVMTSFLKLKNMGLDPSVEALTSYGNTASSMGKGLEQMIEAVADAATGEFERLKEFGIKSRVEGDKIKFTFKGVTTEVKNNSEEIQKYLLNIGETDFAGGMEAQSKTLGGMFSTLKDQLYFLAVQLGEPLKKPLKDLIDLVTAFSQKIIDFVKNNPELAQMIGYALLIATAFAGIAGPILILIGLLGSLSIALGVPALTIGLVIAAILALIIIIGLLIIKWDDLKRWILEKALDIQNGIFRYFNEIQDFLTGILDSISLAWTIAWEGMKMYLTEVLTSMYESIVNSLNVIASFFKTLWAGIKTFFITTWNEMKDFVVNTMSVILETINSYIGTVKNAFGTMWDALKSTLTERVGAVVGEIKSMINTIIGMINKAISGLNKLASTAAGLGGVKIPTLPSIPMLAEGGIVNKPTVAMIGEAGPEAVVPLKKGGAGVGSEYNFNFYGPVSSKEVAMEMMDMAVKQFMLHSKTV